MARLLLGIDIGWSPRKRSCALAVRGEVSLSRSRTFEGNVSVGLYRLCELLEELQRIARGSQERFRDAMLVIDGPVGPSGASVSDRAVDRAFSCGGFYNRAPGYSISHGSGLQLAQATTKVLTSLAKLVAVRPWLGGPLPTDRLVVAETNPTPAMALLLAQQEKRTLPSRSKPRRFAGANFRAKSDWYWHLGANVYAARVLNAPSVENERNHEMVAGLFALALATSLAGQAGDASRVVALGDAEGVYVVPEEIHDSWQADVRRVGIHDGQPRFWADPAQKVR